MFCPRCGRPVSAAANFCGGCGLPKAEMERLTQAAAPAPQPVNETPVNISELDRTLTQLEGDLTGINPVEDYTINSDINTEKVNESFAESEIKLELGDVPQPVNTDSSTDRNYSAQSEYSYNAPKHPYYSKTETNSTAPSTAVNETKVDNQNLSTVDFIWMMLIASIPVVGLLYLIYQGFVQQENVNKRSWARATMIISVFTFVLALVFSVGIMLTTFMFW